MTGFPAATSVTTARSVEIGYATSPCRLAALVMSVGRLPCRAREKTCPASASECTGCPIQASTIASAAGPTLVEPVGDARDLLIRQSLDPRQSLLGGDPVPLEPRLHIVPVEQRSHPGPV